MAETASRERARWESLARERAKSGHALIGPSTWPRVFRCPGSLRLAHEKGLKGRDSEDAKLGTCAHYLADVVLSDDEDPFLEAASFVGRTLFAPRGEGQIEFKVTQEMAFYVQKYIDWCRDLPGEHFTECRVDISPWVPLPQQFGTSDHAAIYEDELLGTVLCVTDLKYGVGEQVYAYRNEQLMAYALGFYNEWKWCYRVDWVRIRICQPRLDHFDEWECSLDDLLAFGDEARAVFQHALYGDAGCTAGEKQCKFCPASGQCSTEKASIDALLMGDFDAFEQTKHSKPELMSIEDLDRVVQEKGLIRNWIAKVEGTLIQRILNGDKAPTQRVVEGRATRKWKDRESAEVFLRKNKLSRSQIIEETLISPSAAEKLLPKTVKEQMAQFWEKPRGKAVLAPISDKRPDYNPLDSDLDDMFDDEGDDWLGN